jgi:hypothetical protein
MNIDPWLWLVPVGGLLGMFLLWRFFHLGRVVLAERARESFRLQQERLAALFLDHASKTGSPRGLRWVSCEFEEGVEFARERHSRRIVALVPVTVRFEAVEGGDMEGLPAVPLPRHGTALLNFVNGEWTASGRVLFNLLPRQVLDQFTSEYEPLPKARTMP